MKTSYIIKIMLMILLIACASKMKAQSDLLAMNVTSSIPSEVIARYNAEEKLRISDFTPNPANNNSIVNVNCVHPTSMQVKFFTLNGDMAKEESYNLEKGMNELNVNLNDLSKGIYMVQFYSKEGSAVRKMVKPE
ncbi:MAG: hypothetical protein JWN78_1402 [Bacteroidota bacterium]|nr:hypothetical protein [Bacteroidota bacterium]